MKYAILLLSLSFASCVTQSLPTHGGGKRFFYEQALIATAVDEALVQLDLSKVTEPIFDDEMSKTRAPRLNVRVVAMGDEGGGVEAPRGALSFLGFGGGGFAPAVGGGSGSVVTQGTVNTGDGSGSHAFANARDLEYLRVRVVEALVRRGARIARGADADRDVYLVVSQFGTAKSSFDMFVYRESILEARTAIDCFYVDHKTDKHESAGSGACTTKYTAQYIFGFGPVGGAEIMITPGAMPVRIKRRSPRAEGDVTP